MLLTYRFPALTGFLFMALTLVLAPTQANAAPLSAKSFSATRVIGGKLAPQGAFPFALRLYVKDRPMCGASMIGYEWAVTAAHCVASSDKKSGGPGQFNVIDTSTISLAPADNSNPIDQVERTGIKEIVVNPNFDPKMYASDIALLHIDTGAKTHISDHTTPISISAANISTGQSMEVLGWGQTTTSSKHQSQALMIGGLVAADDESCRKGVHEYDGLNGHYVCTSFAATPGVGTCFGDSGGPLIIQRPDGYHLIGLVSFDINVDSPNNHQCAQSGDYSYFTRVSHYLPFISKTTGIPLKTLTSDSTDLWLQYLSSQADKDVAPTGDRKDAAPHSPSGDVDMTEKSSSHDDKDESSDSKSSSSSSATSLSIWNHSTFKMFSVAAVTMVLAII